MSVERSDAKDPTNAGIRDLRGTWLLALGMLVLLFGTRLWLQKPPEALFHLRVPVSVRGAPHGDAEELSHRFLYSESFELSEDSSLKLSLRRGAADGILAATLDLVPAQGPSVRGLELFAAQRMSVHGLRGRSRVQGSLRGAPPGRYRLRIAGTWVGQPGEGRIPAATLDVVKRTGSPAAFWWAALLLLSPALFVSARMLWRRRRARTGPSSPQIPEPSDEGPSVDANSDSLSALTPEGSLP
ncbi:MAG: hypothetical protein GXP55_24225 [Deltaproteobacteria bacterium]|nr:hypothetical protein [Deltaproteobacteria bacterium]